MHSHLVVSLQQLNSQEVSRLFLRDCIPLRCYLSLLEIGIWEKMQELGLLLNSWWGGGRVHVTERSLWYHTLLLLLDTGLFKDSLSQLWSPSTWPMEERADRKEYSLVDRLEEPVLNWSPSQQECKKVHLSQHTSQLWNTCCPLTEWTGLH